MQGVTEVCPECQFDPTTEIDVAERFATFAKRYPVPLTRLLPNDPPGLLATRPTEGTWSALEYVGHVAMVCETTTDWIARVGAENTPVIETGDVDAQVHEARFNEVDPSVLAERVRSAATNTSASLGTLDPSVLDRCASLGGMTVPLRLLVVGMVHECHHHLLDVGRVLRTLRQR